MENLSITELSERMRKRGAQMRLDAVIAKGHVRVAEPKKCAESIDKYWGVKVGYNDCMIFKLNNDEQL